MPTQLPTLQIPESPLMFIDIEAGRDQAYIWLISVLVENRSDSFRQFYAETPASEKDILNDFLSYCEEFDGYTICHYGGFDERITRRQMATYGLDSNDPGRWFDLQNSITKSDTRFPKSSSSVKHVAAHLGYEFRHQDVDGTFAPLMYAQNICKQDGVITKKLLEYGEDDVRALQHIMSTMSDIKDTCIDRSWMPPEHNLPSSFEAQCALVKSLKDNGLSIPSIAKKFCVSKKYVRIRWQSTPKKWNGRKVSFETKSAIETGIPSDAGESECCFLAHRKDCIMYGEVIEQVSENEFRVMADGVIFQVHKDVIEGQ